MTHQNQAIKHAYPPPALMWIEPNILTCCEAGIDISHGYRGLLMISGPRSFPLTGNIGAACKSWVSILQLFPVDSTCHLIFGFGVLVSSPVKACHAPAKCVYNTQCLISEILDIYDLHFLMILIYKGWMNEYFLQQWLKKSLWNFYNFPNWSVQIDWKLSKIFSY